MTIHVGDKVKIGFIGAIYSSYPGFLDYYRDVGSSSIIERVCSQYELNHSPTSEEARNSVFTVMFIREHGSMEGRKLAIINDGNVTYIIDINALTIVSSDMSFEVGDRVFITDSMRVYTTWESLVKQVSTVIPDGRKVYTKWTNGRSPADYEINGKSPESIFTIKWIGHHVARPDEAVIAIISNASNTYIISIKALALAGKKNWDKYIIYVRNWAVVNKDSAQSVRDATGPKPYAEWLRNKS